MHQESKAPEIAQESLTDLTKKLQAALENPESVSVGTLALIVGRLRGELAMMADCQDALAYAPTPEGIEWRKVLEPKATSTDLTQEQIAILTAAFSEK